jgi:hypothetical protein
MKTKRFVFEISVEDIPFTEETYKQFLGEDAYYNSDFPPETFVMQDIYDTFKDALAQQLHFKMNALRKPDADEATRKAYLKYCDKRLDFNEKIIETLKLVRIEEI